MTAQPRRQSHHFLPLIERTVHTHTLIHIKCTPYSIQRAFLTPPYTVFRYAIRGMENASQTQQQQ